MKMMAAATAPAGCQPRRYRATTDSKHTQPIAPNVVKRRFTATAPNQLWVTDITYVRTWEGWLYLAVILDVFSRPSGDTSKPATRGRVKTGHLQRSGTGVLYRASASLRKLAA